MNRLLTGALLVILGIASPILAQNTWIVDAAKGSGFSFSDIQPAFNKAKPGDKILVRPGTYFAATTNKGLRLLGSPGVLIQFRIPQIQTELIVVRGLPAKQTFIMKGFKFTGGSLGSTGVFLDGNQGQVYLEDIHLTAYASGLAAQFTRAALRVRNCRQVAVAESTLAGRPGLSVEGSTLALSGCVLAGSNAGQFSEIVWPSHPGLWGKKSRLRIGRCTAGGGAGKVTSQGLRTTSPASVLLNCETSLSGQASEIWRAGTISKAETGMHAIAAHGGQLLVDPTLKLLPQGKSPAIFGSARVQMARIPSLRARGAAPGGRLKTNLHAQRGSLQLLMASTPGPTLILPSGDLWLNPSRTLFLDASIMDKTESRILSFVVPQNRLLQGKAIAFQVLNVSFGRWILSNPAVVILN